MSIRRAHADRVTRRDDAPVGSTSRPETARRLSAAGSARRPSAAGSARRIAVIAALIVAAVLLPVLSASPASAATNQTYWFMSGIGPTFNGSESLPSLTGVATDTDGNVYVTCPTAGPLRHILKFSRLGAFVCAVETAGDGEIIDAGGSATGLLGVTVDAVGNVYVADYWANAVRKYRPYLNGLSATSYVHVCTIGGTSGTGAGQLDGPQDVAVSADGLVYVSERNNNRVQVFRPQPPTFGTSATSYAFDIMWGRNDGDGSSGSGNGEFLRPRGIALDAAGNVYVVDSGNRRVQKFTPAGTFITEWGEAAAAPIQPGQFSDPAGIAVDSAGDVYVTDRTSTSRVQKFRLQGGAYSYVTEWGSQGTGDAEFDHPTSIDVCGGNVEVADSGNLRVKRFARDGTAPLTTITVSPVGWTAAKSVSVTLSAAEMSVADMYSSGVAGIETSTNGGTSWTGYSGPLSITAEGVTAILCRSYDEVGNLEPPQTATVRIDRTGPRTRALAGATVKRGRKAMLRYRVDDSTPRAKVRIVVKRGTRTVKTLVPGRIAPGRSLSCSVKCMLARGAYRFYGYATDLAGNSQRSPIGWKALKVR